MPDDLNTVVASILSTAFKASGLTQVQLAARAGLSQSHISKLLRAVTTIDVLELDAIARALGTTGADVLTEARTAIDKVQTKVQPPRKTS